MSGKVYRIRGLEWKEVATGFVADSHIGHFQVWKSPATGACRVWLGDGYGQDCDSLSDGKAHCEALYRERMERGLEEVKDAGVEDVMGLADELVNRARIRGWDQERKYPTLDQGLVEIRSELESAIRTIARKEPPNAP